MNSMTGFGNSKSVDTQLQIEVSIKTVNSRYLDVRWNMPKEYAVLEKDLKTLVHEQLSRGTAEIYIHRRVLVDHSSKVVVNHELAKKWQKSFTDLSKKLGSKESLSARELASMAPVIEVTNSHVVGNKEKKLVVDNLRKALSACAKSRRSEGRALRSLISSLLAKIEIEVKKMMKLRKWANEKLEERMVKRLDSFGLKGDLDPQRLAQEVVLQVDRADITEEVQRLSVHIQACRRLLKETDPQGKKLDFYCQELLREVNTVGSKSQLAELTEVVVETKTLIEKLREQVQNVE